MAEVILMPRLSDTMTEGVIAAWHKKVGDNVKKGDLLAEVETDKATMDLESYKDGTLLFTGTDKGGKFRLMICLLSSETWRRHQHLWLRQADQLLQPTLLLQPPPLRPRLLHLRSKCSCTSLCI